MSFDLVVVRFFFSSRRRHTSCALVTGVQTFALPIYITAEPWQGLFFDPSQDVRRLARGIVDDARKTIMSRIIAADSELERAVTLDDRLRLCIHMTALHWELVYQKLVPRDEYNQLGRAS